MGTRVCSRCEEPCPGCDDPRVEDHVCPRCRVAEGEDVIMTLLAAAADEGRVRLVPRELLSAGVGVAVSRLREVRAYHGLCRSAAGPCAECMAMLRGERER